MSLIPWTPQDGGVPVTILAWRTTRLLGPSPDDVDPSTWGLEIPEA